MVVEIDGDLPAPGPNGSSGSEGHTSSSATQRSRVGVGVLDDPAARAQRARGGRQGGGGEHRKPDARPGVPRTRRRAREGGQTRGLAARGAKRVNYLYNEQLLIFKAHFLVTGHR